MTQQSAAAVVLTGVATALNVAGMTALAGVVNDAKQARTYPYVLITFGGESREDCMQKPGKSVVVVLHVYSQYEGDLEAATILSKAVELLHYQAITVSGHVLVATQYDQGDAMEPELINGIKTRHFIGIFRVDVRQV